MKLPVFKNLAKNVSIEAMETALEVLEFMVLLACWRLPDIFPEEYQKSAFCMKKRTLHILLFFIGILMIGTSYVNLSDLTVPAAIACGIYILVMFVYTQVRYPYVKAKQEKKEDK